ncbi:DUF488 family protein [Pseudodesulfovibrio cashew]|uniref:DUF488 family protein n=1 Tax=Pseudodesulfovibrio cashew TaxID=2678688 RepID=A0A6I6JNX8_9BACT|nr:DUF488 family protein [Pseudodesulfovibrio cashew]QGY41847.1 DUF488 family protein [Pseudodesulfovibrio cashew]
MPIQVVQLGTARHQDEGIRIGTVRRPPRGVKKTEYASQNWYDVWLPEVAPSPELMKLGQSAETEKEWDIFARKYRRELATPEKSRTLALLAAFSTTSDFSIGCYCADLSRCHVSVLREILKEQGALFKNSGE